jgi:hypothetical protein
MVTCGRFSSLDFAGGYEQDMLGNLVIANKFEADFVAGQILAHESVFT